ncbi:restriction endonuclease subunit S [Halomonas sp. CH40]
MTEHNLPDRWIQAKISDISIKGLQRKPTADESFVYVDIGSIDRRLKKISEPQMISGGSAPSRARKVIENGDVLVSLTRPNLNAVALVDQKYHAQIASTGFEVIKPVLVDSRYVFALVRSKEFVDQISGTVQGALYPAAKSSDVQSFSFSLPPLAEQKAIADKLDTLLAQVETTQARLERIPQILKRFRQSVLAAAVSGKLTEEWRKEQFFERVSVKDIKQCHCDYVLTKTNKYSEPTRFSESSIAYQIPESWEWFRAEELCDLITKGTTPRKTDMSGSDQVPFIKVYNLTFDGKLDFSIEPTFISKVIHETALKRSKVYPGDVLMNIVGPPLGKVSIVPDDFPEWNLNQAISIFRPVCGVTPSYLAICLRDYALLEQTKNKAKATAGQFNLTLEICRDYAIPVPPLKEQTEIVRRVDELFAHADRIEQQVNNALARVNNLTQSILAKAFRGELTEQWRRDNPELISGENSAEALLERIQAERAAVAGKKKARKVEKKVVDGD